MLTNSTVAKFPLLPTTAACYLLEIECWHFHCAFVLFQSCPPYWPSEGVQKNYGPLQVEHAETVTESENIIIRKFKLKHKKVSTSSFLIKQI